MLLPSIFLFSIFKEEVLFVTVNEYLVVLKVKEVTWGGVIVIDYFHVLEYADQVDVIIHLVGKK